MTTYYLLAESDHPAHDAEIRRSEVLRLLTLNRVSVDTYEAEKALSHPGHVYVWPDPEAESSGIEAYLWSPSREEAERRQIERAYTP